MFTRGTTRPGSRGKELLYILPSKGTGDAGWIPAGSTKRIYDEHIDLVFYRRWLDIRQHNQLHTRILLMGPTWFRSGEIMRTATR